jgi:hypothetical protein
VRIDTLSVRLVPVNVRFDMPVLALSSSKCLASS